MLISLCCDFSLSQGPIENDVVIHVALIAESQRYVCVPLLMWCKLLFTLVSFPALCAVIVVSSTSCNSVDLYHNVSLLLLCVAVIICVLALVLYACQTGSNDPMELVNLLP